MLVRRDIAVKFVEFRYDEIESIYVDGTHLNATDAAALKAKASISSSPCALLLTASLLCNTNNLEHSQVCFYLFFFFCS